MPTKKSSRKRDEDGKFVAEQEAAQQQQLIQSLGPAALGSPLVDPKKLADAAAQQQPMEDPNAQQEVQ